MANIYWALTRRYVQPQALSHLMLTTILWSGYSKYSHFAYEEVKFLPARK